MAEILGISSRYSSQPWAHGMWTGTLIAEAAMAVHFGLAECILVGRGVSQTSPHGRGGVFGGANDPESFREGGGLMGEVPWFGMTSPGGGAAMALRRYFHRFGGSSRDLATIAVTMRQHARLNPLAAAQKPITIEDHQRSPLIVDPLRLLDYCPVSDGGACILVTNMDRARRLPKKPVRIAGMQGMAVGRQEFVFAARGLGVQLQDNFDHVARDEDLLALRMAGVSHPDIDAFYTYDAFTCLVPFSLERFGFVPGGEGLAWVQDGKIGLDGALPVNTHGGLLSDGHSAGWGAIVEMVEQIRGQCGARQLAKADALFWGPIYGNALVLTS